MPRKVSVVPPVVQRRVTAKAPAPERHHCRRCGRYEAQIIGRSESLPVVYLRCDGSELPFDHTSLIGITDLVLAPGDPDRILVATLAYGIFESPDRGQTWTPVGPPDLALRELTPLDAHTLLGSDGGELLRSTDGASQTA
jgi:hypothetical protein